MVRFMDKKEIEVYFKNYYGNLVVVANRILCNVDIAEDVVQDVFIKLLHKNSDISQLSYKLLFTMTKNASIDYLRVDKRSQQTLNAEAIEKIETEDSVFEFEDMEKYLNNLTLLSNAIDSLPLRSRQVISMIYLEGYSYKETASILQLSMGTVKTHVFRALQALRQNLGATNKHMIICLIYMLNR